MIFCKKPLIVMVAFNLKSHYFQLSCIHYKE
uniref:Uncharacterized protein n=1 Tax=Arundo donax TaxID=35708 RepID=A0A0A9GGP3_ARUDO